MTKIVTKHNGKHNVYLNNTLLYTIFRNHYSSSGRTLGLLQPKCNNYAGITVHNRRPFLWLSLHVIF